MAGGRSFISNFKAFARYAALPAFVALLAVPLVFFGDLFEAAAKENKVNVWNKQRFEEFYASGPIDALFVGSSHSYCTFDPRLFDEALAANTYQLGMPLQQPDATYATLKAAFEGQSPKVVVMELYWGVMGAYNAKQADMTFQFMGRPGIERAYYGASPVAERVKRAIKPIRYMDDFWAYEDSRFSEFLAERGLTRPKDEQAGVEKYGGKGYIFSDRVITEDKRDRTNQYRGLDGRGIDWTARAERYVEKIAALCAENGAALVLVTAPVAPVSFAKIKHYDMIHGRAAALAERVGVPYIDYNVVNAAENLVADGGFRDDAHLNDDGARVIGADFIRRAGLEGLLGTVQ